MAKTDAPKHTPTKQTPTYKKVETKAKNALARARKYKAELEEKRIPDAAMGAGASLGGSVVHGAAKGVLGDTFWGIPMDLPLGLVGGVVAIGSGLAGMPLGVHAGAGLVYPSVSNLTAVGTRAAIGAIMGEAFGGLWQEAA